MRTYNVTVCSKPVGNNPPLVKSTHVWALHQLDAKLGTMRAPSSVLDSPDRPGKFVAATGEEIFWTPIRKK